MSYPPPQQPKRQASAQDVDAPKPVKRHRAAVPPLPATLSIPESKMYADLVEMEQKLDWTITRKRVEVHEAVGKSAKNKRTLRIFLSNTASFQKPADGMAVDGASSSAGEAGPSSTTEPPSWALKIEGRLIDSGNPRLDKATKHKFSHFVKSITVEMDGRDPSLGPNVIEWIKPVGFPEQDGFTIMRPGSTDVPCRILIHLDHNPARYRCMPELERMVGVKEETRTGFLGLLWGYIKEKGLQDKEDRTKINADANLRQLFQQDKIPLQFLPEYINRFLAPPDPIVLRYTIRVDQERTTLPRCFDVEVELEDTTKTRVNAQLQMFVEEQGKEILSLDEEISNIAIALRNARTKRDFLASFARDPSAFIHRWLDSQARDLAYTLHDASLGEGATGGGVAGTGLTSEDLRRSATFRLPWVEEATVVYEGQRIIERLGSGR